MAKVDLRKQHGMEYVAPRSPVVLTIGSARYLAITGRGKPGGRLFQEQVGALYATAFTIKMSKKAAGRDFKVAGLEGLWWGGQGSRKTWTWKLLIRVPAFLSAKDLRSARAALQQRGRASPSTRRVTLETLGEGQVVQLLHVGRYDREQESIRRMRAFARGLGLGFYGRHHEIYLSDPRRVAPMKLRTILRHPVRRKS